MPGYIGLNCTTKCPYPWYGYRCQGYCDCSNDSCDISTGCRTITTGQTYYLLGHLSDTGDLLCGRRVSCVVRLALIFFSIFNIFENCYANFYHILLKAPLG